MSSRTAPVLAAILVAVTAAVFAPCLRNGFTNWDDWHLIIHNPDVREAVQGHPWKLLSSSYVGTYMPLTMLTYAADVLLWGENAKPLHAENILLHLAVCALVFRCLILLTRRPWASFAGALLFALHPLRVESVGWLAARKDLLYALFFLGSLDFYLRYLRTRHIAALAGSIGCFVLSCLSKGLAVSLPFVLLLCDYLESGRIGRADLKNKIPFFIVAGVFAAIAFTAQGQGAGWGPGYSLLSARNILVGCYALTFYLIKIVLPIGLSCLYPHPENLAHPYSCEFWLSLLAVILVVVLVVRSRRYSRKLIFAAGFFLVAILPVLQFFPVGGQAIAADRYTYVPAIGLSYLAAELLGALWNRKPALLAPLAMCVAILAGWYGALSWDRCLAWRDSITLWTDAISKNPAVATAWYNRGLAYADDRRFEEAFADWTAAMALGHDEACNNRGLIRRNRRDYDGAIADYTLALRRRSDFPQAYYNRGNAWLEKGDIAAAIADYDRAIALAPSYIEAFINRGTAFSRAGELDRAIADFERALAIDPGNSTAQDNLRRCRAARALQQ